MNIVEEIRKRDHGPRIAVRCAGGGGISFDALFRAVGEIREMIRSQENFHKSAVPRVGVIFPNGAGYIAVALAVLEAGACFVPIPDELTEAERKTLMTGTALDFVIEAGDSGFALPLGLGHAAIYVPHQVAPEFPVDRFEALNPAFIRFSSGTTGASKGVVLSHESLMARITAANEGLELQPGDKVLWTLPMAHHFAVTIVLYLFHGVTTVLEPSNRPDLVFRAARDSRTNLLYGSPFHFAQLAQCAEAEPLPDLRMAISTASALTAEVAEGFKRKFHLPVTQALGIIELGLPLLNKAHAADIPLALGQPLPAFEVATGETGELLIRGPGMFDAYLNPWQPREEVLQAGWFATGDLVKISSDRTVTMFGRCKSVINIGGMKVFPEEIEAVLNTHPAVLGSKVFAADHATLGAFPCAEILLHGGCELPRLRELRSFCLEKLASYKVPMQFRAVESIERTASGKIKRH
ncbi:class I adenylate-forming enzyme family protein [Luteolibacter algae]|uniref:Class I adenylate-forming enzyme family protein n=1 Tax=Luteolibacter algae TaxID=454151 RepID=A0ABW5D5R3_9BACT